MDIQCCGARGAVGGSVPCSRSWCWRWRECCTFTPPTDNFCRTRDSNPQPQVTSPTLYPLGHDCPKAEWLSWLFHYSSSISTAIISLISTSCFWSILYVPVSAYESISPFNSNCSFASVIYLLAYGITFPHFFCLFLASAMLLRMTASIEWHSAISCQTQKETKHFSTREPEEKNQPSLACDLDRG